MAGGQDNIDITGSIDLLKQRLALEDMTHQSQVLNSQEIQNIQKQIKSLQNNYKDLSKDQKNQLSDLKSLFAHAVNLQKQSQNYARAEWSQRAQILESLIEQNKAMQQDISMEGQKDQLKRSQLFLEEELSRIKKISLDEELGTLNAVARTKKVLESYERSAIEHQKLRNRLIEEENRLRQAGDNAGADDVRRQREEEDDRYENDQSRRTALDSPIVKAILNFIPGGKILNVLNTVAKIGVTVSQTLTSISHTLDGQIDRAMSQYTQFQTKIEARLQGLGKSASDMVETTRKEIQFSPYIKQEQFLSNLANLTNQGIAFNLEQRALIETVSDKLVSTFDTLDASLTRLIRLQQADLTMSQVGAEAKLTQLLNSQFQDTSYLNNLYDTVASALMEASSTQSADEASAFLYTIQKWLGSLYSVGMSDQAVQTIATAVNYLGSGKVQALGSNTGMQNLLALSATQAGLSYSDLLTGGLYAEEANELMKAMVDYLKGIYETNKTSNVVTSEWGNIINLQISDLKAISNITDEDLTAVYGSGMEQQNSLFESFIGEFNNQVEAAITSRYTLAEKLENFFDNAMFDFGAYVSSNEDIYRKWKTTQLLADTINTVSKSIGGNNVIGTILSVITGIANGANVISTASKWLSTIQGYGSIQDDVSTSGSVFNGLSNLWRSFNTAYRGDTLSWMPMFDVELTSTRGQNSFVPTKIDELTKAISESTEIQINNSQAEERSITEQNAALNLTDINTINTNLGNQVAEMGSSVVQASVRVSQEAAAIESLRQKAEKQSYSTLNTESESQVTRTLDDLYAQLFELDQNRIPIRVQIAMIEDGVRLPTVGVVEVVANTVPVSCNGMGGGGAGYYDAEEYRDTIQQVKAGVS